MSETNKQSGSPQITIVVPVYKVKDYLSRCVESILSQTMADFELILVDDGSPDECGDLCDQYAQKDNRIRVIHKENGGLSDARNAGIAQAKAPYIGFIDSDDYIASDMFEVLYRNLIEHDAEVSICGIYDCYGNKIVENAVAAPIAVMNSEEAIKTALIGKQFSVNAVNKLYKTSLFDDIRYPKGKLSEDAFVTIRLFAKTNRVVFDYHPKYYYFHRQSSITTTQTFRQGNLHVIEAYQNNLELICQSYPQLQKEAEFRLIWANFYTLDKMIISGTTEFKQEKKQIVSYLRRNFFSILSNPYPNFSRKVAACFLMIHTKLYGFFAKMNDRRTTFHD